MQRVAPKSLFQRGSKSERIWNCLKSGMSREAAARKCKAHPKFVSAVWQRATKPEKRKTEAEYQRQRYAAIHTN